ncbi:hypothetical protein OPV22_009890 [Ensete ventricosum]|uniref:Uncharacterized protein n=1 Tax=Ensete ventricosum TaxID=4639 RepID=A0AAV8RGX1_ENSVE|nr:hypothetical protein OPV22_009890 [Ensete ventricosum]
MACYGEVQKFDFRCVCKSVMQEIERAVRMENVVYVAKYCSKTAPRGTQMRKLCCSFGMAMEDLMEEGRNNVLYLC